MLPKKVFYHLMIGYAFLGVALYAFSKDAMWLAIGCNLVGLYHFLKARFSWGEDNEK